MIKDFWNTGTLQGSGILTILKGRNEGLLLGDHLSLRIIEIFENKAGGILKGEESLAIQGQGHFVNEKHARFESPHTHVGIRAFDNKADLDLEKGKLSVSADVKQFVNHEDALLKADEMVLRQRGTFTNAGALSSRRLESKGHHFINTGSVSAAVMSHNGHTFHNQAMLNLKLQSSKSSSLRS